MKLLVLFFSLFNQTLSLKSKKIETQETIQNIQCIYQTIDELKIAYGNYNIIEKNDNLEISYKGERLKLIDEYNQYKVINYDDYIIIFYKQTSNDYLRIIKYNKGKLMFNKVLDNKFIGKFDIIKYDEYYVFVSTVSEYENKIIADKQLEKSYLLQKNAITIIFDENINIIDCNLYGGELDDYFENIYYDKIKELLYIVGRKQQNSGYDFGNGGNGSLGYILLTLNSDLSIYNYCVFDNPIVNLEINDSSLMIYTTKEVLMLNTELSLQMSLKIDDECCFGMKMNNLYNAVFTRRELKIFNYLKNKCVYTYQYPFFNEIEEVFYDEDYLYISDNKQIVKAIFYNDTVSDKEYIYDYFDNQKVEEELLGLPHSFKLERQLYDNDYDPLVFGQYDIIFDYGKFVLYAKTNVLERANVTNDYLYPVGYNLMFSGKGYLNGEEIFNNYAITQEGNYQLKLVGKEKEIVINFSVCDMDINFGEDSLKICDNEVRVNQDLIVDIQYNKDVTIKDIKVNNESYDFKVDEKNKTLTISFNSNESGTVYYVINEITYEYLKQTFTDEINYEIIVRYVKDKISLNNKFYNDDENFIFDITVLENNEQVRFLKMVYNDQYQYIPLKNNYNISIDNQNTDENIEFYVVYDVKGELYEEMFLFDIDYNLSSSSSIGTLELNIEENELKQIVMKIPISDNLKKITINNKVEYQYQKQKSYSLVIYAIVFIGILFLGYKVIKIMRKKDK